MLLPLAIALLVAAPPPQARLEAALREAHAASCPGKPLALDPDLTRAAKRYVDAVHAQASQPDGAALAFYASLESVDPSPTGGVATVDASAQADRAVGDLLPRACRFTHAGVAAADTAGGHGVVAVLTASRSVALQPIAPGGKVAPGAAVRLAGKLLDPALQRLRLYHLISGAKVEEQPIALDGRGFSIDVALNEPGEHALELLADGAGGPEVIALRRVFAGVEPPPSPPVEAADLGEPEHGDALSLVEHRIARLRAAHGLPALARDPALDAISLGHSQEMARAQTFAHVLKSDGSLDDRLLKARYANRYAGENIGLAEDALAAQQAIEESPAHLMNLLDPRHTKLGLGAVTGLTPEGERGVYLTEVLAQPIAGSKDPIADVAQVIADERKRKKLPPLVRDPRLDALALARVRKVAAADGQSADPDLTNDAFEKVPSLTSAVAERLVVGAPEDVKISQDLGVRDWAVLGVGAVYANSKEFGPNRLWVILLYAR